MARKKKPKALKKKAIKMAARIDDDAVEESQQPRQGYKERECPDCRSRDIGHEGGEFYCEKCGLVID